MGRSSKTVVDLSEVRGAARRAGRGSVRGSPVQRSGDFKSSAITNAAYNETTRELSITFTSGATYRYFGVPLSVYCELLDAESKGQFINEQIKGKYDYAEVEPDRTR